VNIKQFKKSPSGRLVKSTVQGQEAWAFVPNPLPPTLEFDRDLLRGLSDADRALGELAGLSGAVPNPHLFTRPLIRREAVLSSRIEGTRTDIAELYAYEAGQMWLFPEVEREVRESDAQEVLNYVRAMEYGLDRLGTLPVSLRLIREVHGRLMEGVRGGRAQPGKFRRVANWIGGRTPREAVYVPPPVPQMREALNAFEKYLHRANSHPPLVRLALIHQHFEAIHPFLDGNGRIGRLLISLLMIHWKLLPEPVLYLSAFFERNRREYYDLLLAVSERGAWREWVLFFLRGVAEQAEDTIHRARKLQDLQIEWKDKLIHARSTPTQLGLADYLFEDPIVTPAEAQRRLGVSYPTALKAVNRLEGIGILQEITGRARKRVYVAGAIVDILK